ncbi:ATP phosphoribosyltransferase regulatory subunit [Haloglomus litoreum]|uniref:ATP phosphoribosyltransferase regulatory subunit n=1 Tax=Haloglomus litoreum TaxID=3034026 RepID=UPI0023E8F060|nr:ATP phosphoribosyltransferase regulatory subunit [Haloglomus sp. DT116]
MTDLDTTEASEATHARGVRQTVETVTRRHGFRSVDTRTLAPASRYAAQDRDGLLRIVDPADVSADEEHEADSHVGSARDGERGGDATVLVPERTRTLARAVAREDTDGLGSSARWRATGPCWRAAGVRPDGRREFHRTAAIRVGSGGSSDAELLSLAGAVLAGCGLGPDDATVRVSHRGVLSAVFDAFGGEIETAAALSATATHDPGTEAYHDALVDAGMNYGQADTVSELLGLGAEDLDVLADLTGSDAVAASIEAFRTVIDAVDPDTADRVAVSLSDLPEQPYYTGPTFRVAAAGDDHPPVIRGGRIDGLVGAAGGDTLPAVGLEIDHPALAHLCSRAE